MSRVFAFLAVLFLAACSRGPDEAALESDVQSRIDKSFKPGLLELAVLKRQGSSPLPASAGGAERVLVYFNATLRLREGYDFKDWEALSPATLAQVLGGTERGVFGVKARENQTGDLLRVYGSGVYERSTQGWTAVAAGPAEAPRAPAEPGSAAASISSKRLLDRLAAEVDIGPPGIDAEADQIISEELEQALRAIQRRRARAHELLTFVSGPADGEYTRVVEAILRTAHGGGRKRAVISVETEGSIENGLLLGRGQANYGILQSDVAWLAASGGGPFAADGPLSRIVALGSLYPEPVHIVVSASSPLRRVEELRGKRVDVGTPQSGTRLNAIGVLQAHGIALQDLAQARGEGTRAAIADLRAGHIDAFVLTVGAPAQVIQRLAAEHPIRLLPVSSAAAARLVGEQRGLVALALPANTYPGQSEAVATVAPTALLAAAIDTPGDEVKALLELAFERTDYLASGSAQGVKIAKATGLRGIAIPLHPAAAAYFGSAPKARGGK